MFKEKIMKFKWDKKYLYWGMTAFVVLCLSMCFCYLLFNNTVVSNALSFITGILMPVFAGLVISFLLNPVINWFENTFFPLFSKKYKDFRSLPSSRKKLFRTLSIVLSYLIILLIIAGFVISVIPQVKDSISTISSQTEKYRQNALDLFENTKVKHPELYENVLDTIDKYSKDIENYKENTLKPWIIDLANNAKDYATNAVSFIWDVVLGVIFSVYILAKKESFKGQSKKIVYSLFKIKTANRILSNSRLVIDKFSGFIVGKIIDSFIIGLLCFIVCTILRIDYALLLSIIIGVTNIIPFFGPIIGAVPTTLFLLFVNPLHALYFLITVIVLQLLDGNVIGPKILGSSTGLSSFWVLFAITIFGGIWGVPGMIIGVPLFACLYVAVKTFIDNKLDGKALNKETYKYIYLDYIDSENDNAYIDTIPESVIKEEKKKNKTIKEKKRKKRNKK